jgi:hypothetical protein
MFFPPVRKQLLLRRSPNGQSRAGADKLLIE